MLVGGLLLGGLWGGSHAAKAQTLGLTSENRPIQFTVGPLYQRYEDGDRVIAEASTYAQLYVPIGERLSVQAYGSVASAAGPGLTRLTGFNDVRLDATYAQPIGEGTLVGRVAATLPSGKAQLTLPEDTTATLLSLDFYDFRVPSFGQGTRVAPRLTFAYPVTEGLVLGIGATYRYVGAYRPLQNIDGAYDPGNAVRVSAGADVRLAPNAALSADVAYTRYGDDTQNGQFVFGVGDRMTGTLQYLRRTDGTTLRLVARYRHRWESRAPGSGTTSGGAQRIRALRVLPPHGLLRARYGVQLTRAVRLNVQGTGHVYRATSLYDRKVLGALRLMPSVTLGRFTLVPRLGATYGSFWGVEGGLRFGVSL